MMRAIHSPAADVRIGPAIALLASLAAATLAAASGAGARTFLVPKEMKTIQGAVDRASPGDTVLIGPGVYRENVIVEKSRGGILLKGEKGWRETTLDAGEQGRVLTFIEVSGDTRVEDLTLRNGGPAFDGGGIYVYNGRLAVARCRITGNRAEGDGGGIAVYDGDLFLNECTIQSNSARRGGAIHSVGSKVKITRSSLTGNTADESGGGLYADACDVVLIRNYVVENRAASLGGGIAHVGSRGNYNGNVIARNSAPSGGGLYCESEQPVLKDNSFSGNTPEQTLGCTGAP